MCACERVRWKIHNISNKQVCQYFEDTEAGGTVMMQPLHSMTVCVESCKFSFVLNAWVRRMEASMKHLNILRDQLSHLFLFVVDISEKESNSKTASWFNGGYQY